MHKKLTGFLVCLSLSFPIIAQEINLVFEKTEHDFGKIPEEGGKVETLFYFTNTGKSAIQITEVKASCGCTAAEYTEGSIMPNKGGYVKATFDPAFRPGRFIKTIQVHSTGIPALQTLIIQGEVLPRPKGPEDFYPTLLGTTRFSTNHFSFGELNKMSVDTQVITLYNTWHKNLDIISIESPAYMTFIPATQQILSGKTATIKAILHGNKTDEYGFVFDQAHMFTSDSAFPSEKILYISYTMNPHFPKMSKKDSLKAPRIAFDTLIHSFGNLKAGEKVSYDFVFKNKGKKPLEILQIKTSCGCTAGDPEKKILQPGETSYIRVHYDTRGRAGLENRTVSVISNSPSNPNITLTIQAVVE